MIQDFRQTDHSAAFDVDVCIVGSGAAGLTLAHQLGQNLRVLVIEAGDVRPRRGDEAWLAGEATQFPFAGFVAGRRRAFGGATRAWFGQCIRLDPIDFEARPWVAHSGWPIDATMLAPFYDRAERLLGLGQPDYDARIWRARGMRDPGLEPSEIVAKFTAYCPEPDFTRVFGRRHFQAQRGAHVLLNAAAIGIALDSDARRVTGVPIRGDGGKAAIVQARAYVLCGGGIETPRLMLAAGVGNAHGLVGRFFQDHPSGTTGIITTDRPRRLQDQFRKLRHGGLLFWPKLALSEAAQRRGRWLNANALMLYDYDDHSALTRAKALLAARQPAALVREGWRVLRHVPELAGRGLHAWVSGRAPIFAPSRVMLKAHVEQVPDPDNRVTLSDTPDRFGLPRPRLAWRMHEDELRTLRAITELAGAELHRLGFGRITLADWLAVGGPAVHDAIEDTYHHAGTTRMATTPGQGVVDPDCRVFGLDNLYIAGSSVFPTSGYANPTLTIVALALRLADTLQARLAA